MYTHSYIYVYICSYTNTYCVYVGYGGYYVKLKIMIKNLSLTSDFTGNIKSCGELSWLRKRERS